jgi:hypothetical protein
MRNMNRQYGGGGWGGIWGSSTIRVSGGGTMRWW